MSTSKLFIPKKLKVGFDPRPGTYTGKLAYIIYYDEKNKLRKETSLESWRDKSIDCIELDNEPQSGFVLNKGVGGKRESYGWNTRNEYIRVYDPRNNGFEFEISVANLLFILRECDCSKGKGLEGKFVYAWEGKELILLPVESEDYKQSMEFTSLKDVSFKSSDLIKGASYLTKKMDTYVYIEKLNYNHFSPYGSSYASAKKEYVFYDPKSKKYFPLKLKEIGKVVDETLISNYSDLLEKYLKSHLFKKIVDFRIVPNSNRYSTYYLKDNSIYSIHQTVYNDSRFSFYSGYNREVNYYLLKKLCLEKGSVIYSSEYIKVPPLEFKKYTACSSSSIQFIFEDGTTRNLKEY